MRLEHPVSWLFYLIICKTVQTMTLAPSLHSLVSHKRTEVSAEFQRLNVLLLRAGTGRRIGTALLTDARVQVRPCQVLLVLIILVDVFRRLSVRLCRPPGPWEVSR